jgi:hypothetical protein
MLDFRQSLINSTLRKVLKRLHYSLESDVDLRALVCGQPVSAVNQFYSLAA